MEFFFHPDARDELLQAIDYYEDCEPFLGFDLSLEIRSTIQNICDHPEAWPILEEPFRRCLTKRFPFGVIYSIEPQTIFILAGMSLHRHPNYWKERLS